MQLRRALLLCTTNTIGGTERVVLDLARLLPQFGIEPLTYFPGDPPRSDTLEWARQLGVPARVHPALRHWTFRRGRRDLLAMRAFVRSTGAPVVNIHYGGSAISVWDIAGIRLAGVRRCIAMPHHAVPHDDARARRMTTLAARLCHQVVGTTPVMRRILIEAGVPLDKIAVIPLGVTPPSHPPRRSDARAQLGIPDEVFLISSAGRMEMSKGIDDLIAALALVPDDRRPVRLVVGGDGAARPAFEALAAAQLGERARFLGRVPDLAPLYAASDLFVLPSHEEGFGLVYIEAAFHGVPSIGTNVGGVPYAIVDGETGLIVPDRNPEAIAAAVRRLRDDDALRLRMGAAARDRAEAGFTDLVMAERYSYVLFAHNQRRPRPEASALMRPAEHPPLPGE